MTLGSEKPNLSILQFLNPERATLHVKFYHSIRQHDQDFESDPTGTVIPIGSVRRKVEFPLIRSNWRWPNFLSGWYLHQVWTRSTALPLRRFVALVLLSLTFLCIFEDLFALNSCAENGPSPLPESRPLALNQTAKSPQVSPTDSSDKDHDCLCCCRHVLVAGFFQPIQVLSVSFVDSTPSYVGFFRRFVACLSASSDIVSSLVWFSHNLSNWSSRRHSACCGYTCCCTLSLSEISSPVFSPT